MSRLRLGVLGATGLTALSLLTSRLVQMQLREGAEWEALARGSTVVAEPIPAPRGRMLDCHGRLLVSNEPCFQLAVLPAELPDRRGIAVRLAGVLGTPAEALDKRLKAAPPLERLVLRRSLTSGEMTRLLAMDLPGVRLEVGSRRRFAHGRTAAHLLGTMGEISARELPSRRKLGYAAGDPMGRSGLERHYDQLLRGRKGARMVAVDVLGRTVRVLDVRDPLPGADLQLTLDLRLQMVAERALAETLAELQTLNGEESSGAVVVLEARTGRVRALASLPNFDPAAFARGIKPHELDTLYRDRRAPLLHRAYQTAFSPGSTFKLITSSSALQEGLCTSHSIFVCGGSYMGASCFVTSGHGAIGFEGSLAHSCDVVYYRLGHLLGIHRLDRYCSAYGLGRRTGLDVPGEIAGLLPTPEWKQARVGEEWYPGDTVNMSIGQGFLLVTPLQMAVATAAVANGGKVPTPYLLEQAVTRQGRVAFRRRPMLRRLPIRPEHLAAVRQGM
ncbi:MAG: penicillin-binding protein 2, partial [Candidatus Eremiobacterota bacterium]